MKLNKIISVISLGVTGAAFPLSVVFNSYKKTNTKSLINKTTNGVINKDKTNTKVLNNETENLVYQSSDSFYDFEKNDYFKGFITFKGNFDIFNHDNILKLIRQQPQVLYAKKSLAINNYYLVTLSFKKNSDDKKQFDSFLNTYDLVGDFYEIENDEKIESNPSIAIINGVEDSYVNGGGLSQNLNRYRNNFESNYYTDLDKNVIIQHVDHQVNYYGQKRIGIAVLEVGEGDKHPERALIDANNSYYFDKKITNVYNRWDPYWNGLFHKPTYGNHSTEVASVISGINGVNPYHNLYGVKVNLFNSSLLYAFSGLDNEIDYIRRIDNLKIVNNSWGIGKPKNANSNLFKYNYYSRFLDLLTANERDLIFVIAAGNEGNTNLPKLFGFDLSYNSILVGSNNDDKSLSWFSSRGSNTYSSPLILANGSSYPFKNSRKSGTSYSAPFVSGVLANTLIQYKEKYKLGINSIIAKAALGVSSTNEKNDKTVEKNRLDPSQGVGILNYQKLWSAFNNLKYIKWTDSSDVLVNNLWKSKNVDKSLTIERLQLKKGDNLRISLSWLFKPSSSTVYRWEQNNKDLTSSINYDEQNFNLIFRKTDGNIFKRTESLNNFEFLQVPITEDGSYEIIVSKPNQKPSKTETELALSWTKERI